MTNRPVKKVVVGELHPPLDLLKMPVNYKATAALMGGTGVIMGAFGAHALKALLTVSARAATGPTTSFGESIMNDERS